MNLRTLVKNKMSIRDYPNEHQMIRMTVVLSIITIGFISAIFGLSMLMQVVNGSMADKQEQNKIMNNYFEQLQRSQSQEACSILDQKRGNYTWNQTLDACIANDGRIILKVKDWGNDGKYTEPD